MQESVRTFSSMDVSVVDDRSESVVRRTSEAVNERGEVVEVVHLDDGYVEVDGYVFHEDWDEIDPPGSDDEPGIPHEVVMAEIREMLRKPIGRG